MAHTPRPTIARQVALGFGLVSVVATLMGGFLVFQLLQVGNLVSHMQHDEHAIRHGSELSTAVREQYMHLAHTVIEGNDSHVGHFRALTARVAGLISELKHQLPEHEQWRLSRIEDRSAALNELLTTELLPALRQDRTADVRRLHRQAIEWSTQTAEQGDEVARLVEGRMAGAHTDATSVTRLGLIIGAICVTLVLGLSAIYTVRLRATIVQPMTRLAEAAERVGAGDLHSRIGAVAQGEIQAVANAFDHMAAELSAREGRLVQAERMAAIGQLAAGVAHEMNNPIGIIRGYLRTMTAHDDPETLAEELQILDEEAAACQRIAEDLLAYARVSALQQRPVNLPEFLGEAIHRLDAMLDTVVELHAEPVTIEADPARLRQVLANLLRNAAAASPGDQPLRVEAGPTATGAVLRVLDRGPGVAPEDRTRVFEPFYSKRSGGSGLGLAVCQGLIGAHGGTIEVHPRPEGGAIFEIHLPAHAPEAA